jgi:hypothetical protein
MARLIVHARHYYRFVDRALLPAWQRDHLNVASADVGVLPLLTDGRGRTNGVVYVRSASGQRNARWASPWPRVACS